MFNRILLYLPSLTFKRFISIIRNEFKLKQLIVLPISSVGSIMHVRNVNDKSILPIICPIFIWIFIFRYGCSTCLIKGTYDQDVRKMVFPFERNLRLRTFDSHRRHQRKGTIKAPVYGVKGIDIKITGKI